MTNSATILKFHLPATPRGQRFVSSASPAVTRSSSTRRETFLRRPEAGRIASCACGRTRQR